MPPPAAKPVGVAITDSFQYSVASVADGSFTKLVYKNGSVVANTGITVTYVSDWEYKIDINGSTGFPATAGVYDLVVYVTAAPTNRWIATYDITPAYYQVQGGFNQPVATFTAAASNLRVMSGGSPLSGATVTVLRPSGSVLLQAVTDTNGLWGSIAMDVAGVYTVVAQKSNYTAGQGTITVSGSSATGSGADLSLTGTSTSSGVTASSLWAYARRQYQDHVGTKADTEIREAVDDALYLIASQPMPDSWYQTLGTVTLNGAYQTGTVAITNGSTTVTLSSGTWPTWAGTNAEILLTDGLWYRVATRDSTTQITLTSAFQGNTGTGLTYTLAQMQIVLPSDCRKISEVIRTQYWIWGPDPVSRALLEMNKQTWVLGSSGVSLWSVERDRMVIWPYSTTTSAINLLYFRAPAKLVSDTDTADWDPLRLEVLERAIDYAVSARGTCVAGDRKTCMAAFEEAYSRAAQQDRTSTTARVGLGGVGSSLDNMRYNARIT
jgi:hypothetical protein